MRSKGQAVVPAFSHEIAELKGTPTEALRRATTDEAREILTKSCHEGLRAVVLSYIDEVLPAIIADVRRIQRNMLGEGCILSPRFEW